MQIYINKSTLWKKFPNGYPQGVEDEEALLRYALRRNMLKLPEAPLRKAVNHLWETNRLTVEQFQTLDAALNSKVFSQVLNNRQIKNLIKLK